MRMFVLHTFLLSSMAIASDVHRTCYIKPCEIKGDFDGDNRLDTAVLVSDEQVKRGIKISFANKKSVILGAGEPIGNGGNNFDWMDRWTLHKGKIKQGSTEPKGPPTPKGDSLLLEKMNSASGIVYWNGSEFEWFQQGD